MTRRLRLKAAVALMFSILSAAALAFALTDGRDLPVLAFVGILGMGLAVVLGAALAAQWVVSRAEQRLRARIDDARAKTSRHEYHQERTLERIERTGRELAMTTSGLAWAKPREVPALAAGKPPRVLFVTSNGGGMGHIARCAAVIRHSEGELTGRILTLSTAAETVRNAGFDVAYFPSQEKSQRGPEWWRRQFTRRLMAEVAEQQPQAIVFDGTWVYPSLTDVAEYTDLPLVWLRRGLWREGTDLSQVLSWREHVSAVITPEDIAEDRENAPEPFRDAIWTPPVSLAPTNLPSREDALRRLGLDSDQKYALVQLSGGNGDGSATSAAVNAIRGASDVIPVVVRSPLLRDTPPPGSVVIDSLFPLVDVSASWAFTITGAGYNSVHENLHTLTPGVYLPSAATITDDQERRAAAIAKTRTGLVAQDVEGLRTAVRDLVARTESTPRAHQAASNGASVVAGGIKQLLETE